MKDISSSGLIKLKGVLFLVLGLLSALLLWRERPTLKTGLLLVLAVWCFCRFYYFAFYVIEKYIDPNYKFSGVLSFVRYMLQTKRQPR